MENTKQYSRNPSQKSYNDLYIVETIPSSTENSRLFDESRKTQAKNEKLRKSKLKKDSKVSSSVLVQGSSVMTLKQKESPQLISTKSSSENDNDKSVDLKNKRKSIVINFNSSSTQKQDSRLKILQTSTSSSSVSSQAQSIKKEKKSARSSNYKASRPLSSSSFRIISIWQRCFKSDFENVIDRQLDILQEIQDHITSLKTPVDQSVLIEFTKTLLNEEDISGLFNVFKSKVWHNEVKLKVVQVISAHVHYIVSKREDFIECVLNTMLNVCCSSMENDQCLMNWLLELLHASVVSDFALPGNHFDDKIYTLIVRYYEKIMDKMTHSSYLFKIMETINYIADKAHAPLFYHFQAIVDLLIGWNINEDTSEGVSNLIIDSFEKLWPYWAHNSDFSFRLLSEMIDDIQNFSNIKRDMTVMAEPFELQKEFKSSASLPVILVPLLKCTFAILNGVGHAYFPSFNNYLQKKPNQKILDKMLKHTRTLFQLIYTIYVKYDNSVWRTASIYVVSKLRSLYVEEFTELRPVAATIVLTEINNLMLPDSESLRNDEKQSIRVFSELEKNLGPFFKSDQSLLIDILLNPLKSPVINDFKKLFIHNPAVISAYLKVVKALIRNCFGIPFFESISVVVRCFIDELVDIIENREDHFWSFEYENPFRDYKKKNLLEPLYMVLFNVSCLTELARSIDETQEDKLNIQIALQSLYSRIDIPPGTSDDYAIDNLKCALITSCISVSSTARYWVYYPGRQEQELIYSFFWQIIVANDFVVHSLLVLTWLRDAAILMCGDWKIDHFIHSKLISCFQEILSILASTTDGHILSACLDVLHETSKSLSLFQVIYKDQEEDIFKVLEISLQSQTTHVQEKVANILLLLNPLRTSVVKYKFNYDYDSLLQTIYNNPCPFLFKPPYFQYLMIYLGVDSSSLEPKSALHFAIFHQLFKESGYEYIFNQILITSGKSKLRDWESFLLSMDWIIIESIKYCISSKLRTYLGGPKEFFESIERCLSTFSRGIEIEDPVQQTSRQRLHLLLKFIDLLETQITAMGECYSEDLPKSTLLFFVTNKRVCHEWFSKTRPLFIDCCKISLASEHLFLKACIKSLMEKETAMKKNPGSINSIFRSDFNNLLLDTVKVIDIIDDKKNMINLSNYLKLLSITSIESLNVPYHIYNAFHYLIQGDYDLALNEINCTAAGPDARFVSENFYGRSALYEKVENYSSQSAFSSFSINDDILKLYEWDQTLFKPNSSRLSGKELDLDALSEKTQDFLSSKLQCLVFPNLLQPMSLSIHQLTYQLAKKIFNLKFMLTQNLPIVRRVDHFLLLLSKFSLTSETVKENTWTLPTAVSVARVAHAGGRDEMAWSIVNSELQFPTTLEFYSLKFSIAKKTGQIECVLDQLADVIKNWQFSADPIQKASLKDLFLDMLYPGVGLNHDRLIQITEKLLPLSYAGIGSASVNSATNPKSLKKVYDALLRYSLKEFSHHGKMWRKYSDFHFSCFKGIMEQPVDVFLKHRVPEKFINLINIYALKKAIAESKFSVQGDAIVPFDSNMTFSPKSSSDLPEFDTNQIWISDPTEDVLTKHEMNDSIRYMIQIAGNHLQMAYSGLIKCLIQFNYTEDEIDYKIIHLITNYPLMVQQLKMLSDWFNRVPVSFLTRHKDRWVARLLHSNSFIQDFSSKLLIQAKERAYQHVQYELAYIRVCARFNVCAEKKTISGSNGSQIFHPITKIFEKLDSETNILARVFIELQNLTWLWEDMWISEIRQKQAAVLKTIQTLENERKFNQLNEPLDTIKNRMLAPVIQSFTSLMNETVLQHQVHSKYKQQFIDAYKVELLSAFDQLKAANNYLQIKSSWSAFLAICTKMLEQSKKLRHLKVREVSPFLASFRGYEGINIPGNSMTSKSISLVGFEKSFKLILTKTRPKTLSFKGSDGLNYRFLLKATEDLRLDQRILDVTQYLNSKLEKSENSELSSLTFDVVPFGETFGLVQWINGLSQIFGLFKAQEQRKSTIVQQQKRPGSQNLKKHITKTKRGSIHHERGNSSKEKQQAAKETPSTFKEANTTILNYRPNDVFHQALYELSENRQAMYVREGSVSLDILKQVHDRLCEDHPSDVISNVLLLTCPSSSKWLKKIRTFADSLGVMSMIGYAMGLGDRHLDNILLNTATGEVLHIDFNVCFEKGQKLRIPEYVPFRLTRNFQKALGFGGPYGQFKNTMKSVYHILRQTQETWISLFEDFLIDPVIEYTSLQTNASRHQMSRIYSSITAQQQINGQKITLGSTSSLPKRRIVSSPPKGLDDVEMKLVESPKGSKANSIYESSPIIKPSSAIGSLYNKSIISDDLLTAEEEIETPEENKDKLVSSAYSSHDDDDVEMVNDSETDNIFRAQQVIKRLYDKMNHQNVDGLVDSLIQEATSNNNLARMYPGWMSWI